MFSMGFKSGDRPGQGNVSITFSMNLACVNLEVCAGALSCWSTRLGYKCLLSNQNGNKCSVFIVFMYTSELTLLFTITQGPKTVTKECAPDLN